MPLIQKTVYIREEDIEAWNKVPNKAEFIHRSLKPLEKLNDKVHDLNYIDQDLKPIKTENIKETINRNMATCKQHGIDKNLCRMMKH